MDEVVELVLVGNVSRMPGCIGTLRQPSGARVTCQPDIPRTDSPTGQTITCICLAFLSSDRAQILNDSVHMQEALRVIGRLADHGSLSHGLRPEPTASLLSNRRAPTHRSSVRSVRGPLGTLSFDDRQHLIRTVLERVMVEDGRIDLHFAIPLPAAPDPPATTHVSTRFRLRSNDGQDLGVVTSLSCPSRSGIVDAVDALEVRTCA